MIPRVPRVARPALRVRSIPAGHDYVRHAVGPAAGVLVLADPVLDPADPSRWWPHPALEAAGRPEVLDGADVVHVHFGYEHRTPGQVAGFVSAVRDRGLPLVVTVHDLTNPHEADPAAHLERTGHLVRGASAVITLTAGAAAEIRRLWGVDAQVIPHPRLMPAEVTEPYRLQRSERHERGRQPDRPQRAEQGERATSTNAPAERKTVGVVLGSLRAGVAAEGLLPQLADALPDGANLLVMVRSDALAAARDPGHARHAAALALGRLATRAEVEVRPHELLTDDELCQSLSGFDALVLPHRHGTHSGWLELCRDLGVPPVIPEVGCLLEQWGPPAGSYDPEHPGAAELRRALQTALASPPVPARTADAEDSAVRAAHAELYWAAIASRAASSSVGSAGLVED
ncbi:glycosyltransferase [Rhodococcus sp. IEGM 1408]|uniref:glycosyltransferase n=1 Tax=Rhodococcus sp. IEGM 1408 TaxID=3082220 RepID=UPI002954B2FC|nr:glycosyltransferase [Rhodococcus sp. IEGM 1408]MDV7999920.1 glycosyltransferase [Rhodococcus sp. IEGM 1408]